MTHELKKPSTDLKDFANTVAWNIPISQFMGVSYSNYNGESLRVDVPLAPNINDKRTGFGGSIVALATLAGWSLLSLIVDETFTPCQIMIGESSIRYLAPAHGSFYAQASINPQEKQELINAIQSARNTKIPIKADVFVGNKIIAIFTGIFFIRPDNSA